VPHRAHWQPVEYNALHGGLDHESTPIQPLAERGHRDTLVVTFRAKGFQGPA
jgi:hypothetical protein